MLKMSNIKSPASLWVFLDAHPDTGSAGPNPGHPYDGTFSLPPGYVGANSAPYEPGSPSYYWNDYPASYHNKRSCGFSFADGHAEMHRWLDSDTLVPVVPGTYNATDVTVYGFEDQDILWLFLHSYNSGIQ
jgi:prepilin-type processing-associated H-X9-DG protein